jgi:P27 family predicted phage terminase small subunit
MGKYKGKPTQLKVLEGNRSKVPLPLDEFKPTPKTPKVPVMSKEAKEIYDYYAKQLERAGLISYMDRDALANVARMIERVNEIDLEFQNEETKLLIQYTEMAPNGTEKIVVKLNPLAVEQRQLIEAIRRSASEFGMTPRGRVGLSVGSRESDKNPMEGMID